MNIVKHVLLLVLLLNRGTFAESWATANARVQDKIVKIYGAGGIRGLEAYQSGFLISEAGHILTVWSYVLDTDAVTVVTSDGRRLTAELVGADPRLEIAVLKIDGSSLPFFDLQDTVSLQSGDRVLAFSNLYGIAAGSEQASLLHGVVSAVVPLAARRGVFATPYDGPAYVLDAMTNNAGAAGGALTDYRGRLAGILGKELRSSDTNLWLNYAVPGTELRGPVEAILQGKQNRVTQRTERLPEEPATLAGLGIVVVPQVLPKTPPYVERIVPDSPASEAGLRADDLIVMIDGQTVSSGEDLLTALRRIDRIDPVRLMLKRDQTLIDVELVSRTMPSAAETAQ